MSLDLEQLYEGMGQRADRVALPPLESLRGRARRHRAFMIVGTAAPVVAVLTAVAVVWSMLAPAAPIVVGQGFLTFDGDARPVLRYGVRATDAMTIIRDNTVYARWTDTDNQEYVAAIDLVKLKPLWGPVKVGHFIGIHQIWASRGAVLAAASVQDSSGDQLVALDPANGNVMWRLDFHFEVDRMLLYDDIAVVSLSDTKDITAVDLKTGGMRWASGWSEQPLGVTAIRGPDEFTELGAYGNLPTPADHRFVTHHADGRIQVRDGDNGQLLGEFAGGPGAVSAEVAFNGALYSGGADGVTQTDLGQGQSRKIYTDAVYRLSFCGASLLCVLGDELVVIDTASGRELWRAPAQWTRGHVVATPLAIRVPTADGGHAIHDPSGKRLMTVEGTPYWADDEHLLVWEKGGTVSTYAVHTGERAVLGRAEERACSWTRTMLACPTEDGISVWRYRVSG